MTDREFLFDDDITAAEDVSIEGTLTLSETLPASEGGVDPGFITITAASTTPTSWLDCNGAAVSRTTYSDLFSAIGTAYGTGDGSTTFNVPDLRSRVPVGAASSTSSGLTARARGADGGEEKHALTTGEMPSHTHTIGSAGAHNHPGSSSVLGGTAQVATGSIQVASGSVSLNQVIAYSTGATTVTSGSIGELTPSIAIMSAGAHTHTVGSTGSGTAHENMAPWVGVRFIIYAGA